MTNQEQHRSSIHEQTLYSLDLTWATYSTGGVDILDDSFRSQDPSPKPLTPTSHRKVLHDITNSVSPTGHKALTPDRKQLKLSQSPADRQRKSRSERKLKRHGSSIRSLRTSQRSSSQFNMRDSLAWFHSSTEQPPVGRSTIPKAHISSSKTRNSLTEFMNELGWGGPRDQPLATTTESGRKSGYIFLNTNDPEAFTNTIAVLDQYRESESTGVPIMIMDVYCLYDKSATTSMIIDRYTLYVWPGSSVLHDT